MCKITLRNICKTYRHSEYEVPALKNVSLEIGTGELVAIVGTSGSGKTTLLNILGLIDRPDSGIYLLDDIDMGECSDKELSRYRNSMTGFVLQDFGLLNRYTVEENVKIPLKYSDIPKKEWDRRIYERLKSLGIDDKAKRRPYDLSGGQKQRVSIARALITGAEVILADEPTGALDHKTSMEIMDQFRTLNREGKSVIIVTHDSEIAGLCDRIVRIEDGEIVS